MSRDPIRTCTGCRRKRPQAEMLRIARLSDGSVAVDFAGLGEGSSSPPVGGRGAYVCPDRSCVVRAMRSGAVRRALRYRGDLPEGVVEELLRRVEKGVDGQAQSP